MESLIRDFILEYKFIWWHSFIYLFAIAFILSPIDFIKMMWFNFSDFLKSVSYLIGSFHEIAQMLSPGSHKTQTKSRYTMYFQGHYHEHQTTTSCSCGKKNSGTWTITGLKVSREEGRVYNEKNQK